MYKPRFKIEVLDAIYKRTKALEAEDKKQVAASTEYIEQYLKSNFCLLEVDFIIESLTELGHAPQVLYDDNGLFAVTSNGYQPVVMGDERIEGAMTAFVEKDQWFKTIREALFHYINKE